MVGQRPILTVRLLTYCIPLIPKYSEHTNVEKRITTGYIKYIDTTVSGIKDKIVCIRLVRIKERHELTDIIAYFL